jgi:GNAT superfamily N-acetyltransferase
LKHSAVRRLEQLALAAWPAPVVEQVGGWVLRFAHGVTGRANSVWTAEDDGRLGLDEKIEAAELFYERHGVGPRFQLTPVSVPMGLDDALDARGYRAAPPVVVQTAVVGAVPDSEAAVLEHADDAWLETWLTARGFEREAALAAAAGIFSAPGAFARLPASGPPFAIGRAVVADGHVGIFAMQTLPEVRRRGYAREVLHALLGWGAREGASHAYLQVEETNAPARALYDQYGFETVYAYVYRYR